MSRSLLSTASSVIGLLAALVSILYFLGVIPWVSAGQFTIHEQSMSARIGRIEKQVDDIHAVIVRRETRPEQRE